MKIRYNTATKKIDTTIGIGDTIPQDITLEENQIWVDFLDDRVQNSIKFLNYEYSSLEHGKELFNNILNGIYKSKVEQGYFNETFNITLKIGEEDINKFSNLLAMTNLANELNQNLNGVRIADINSQFHTLSVTNLKILLLNYGVYCENIWAEFTQLKNSINNASTIEELVNLNLEFSI